MIYVLVTLLVTITIHFKNLFYLALGILSDSTINKIAFISPLIAS